MKIYYKNFIFKTLYIFFISLSLNIFFFSTVKSEGKAFDINKVDISRPFEINFNKNDVIDEGFQKAFYELISLIVKSSDQEKINQIKLNEIKGMIESFTIKEEKFINEVYNVNLGVSFNKKKIFNYLTKKNILPSIPVRKKILFIPIIIDETKKELLIFSGNKVFDKWNDDKKNSHLIEYILPTEDLEDLNIIKKKYELIEQYDFKEITNKYYLDDSIITLIFKNDKEIRILSRILIKNDIILKNQSYSTMNLNDEKQVKELINELKIIYEDYWKNFNQINTSIKLPLNIKVNHNDNFKVSKFEKILIETDLIYDFFISKFDKDFTFYQIIFNSTPGIFLKIMNEKNLNFNTQNKIWILK
jgi:hypothetical protein